MSDKGLAPHWTINEDSKKKKKNLERIQLPTQLQRVLSCHLDYLSLSHRYSSQSHPNMSLTLADATRMVPGAIAVLKIPMDRLMLQ
jgi:hypothetical protein